MKKWASVKTSVCERQAMADHQEKEQILMIEGKKEWHCDVQEHDPPAHPWTPDEDSVLCKVVHECGKNWQLATDALAGMPDGAMGRYRHPLHCRQRFQQLLAEKAVVAAHPSSGTKQLLDNEPTVQHHFAAISTAVDNERARNQTGSHKMCVGGSKAEILPHGRDFIPCPYINHPVPTPALTPAKRTFAQMQGCLSAPSVVGEALVSADLDKHAMVGSTDVMAWTSNSGEEMEMTAWLSDSQVPGEAPASAEFDGIQQMLELIEATSTSSSLDEQVTTATSSSEDEQLTFSPIRSEDEPVIASTSSAQDDQDSGEQVPASVDLYKYLPDDEQIHAQLMKINARFF